MLRITEPIATERLLLRPLAEPDLDDVAAYMARPEVLRYIYQDFADEAEAREGMRGRLGWDTIDGDGDAVQLAMQDAATARVVGHVSLGLVSTQHRQAEIGFVVDPQQQRRGYGREAAQALLRLAFDVLDAHRVFACTDARNEASAALLRTLGMRQEAHFRHNEIFKGEWGDELVLAILEDEWRALQGTGRSNQRTSQ